MAQDITYNDIKAAVQGLDPASAVEVAQIAQLAVKKAGAEGKNFDGSPSTSGAVFVPSAYSTSLKFDAKRLVTGQTQIAAATAFVADMTGAVAGSEVYMRLVADGVSAVTFGGMTEVGTSMGYRNALGIVNIVQAWYDGTDVLYSVAQKSGAVPIVIPALSSITIANATPNQITLGYTGGSLQTGANPAGGAYTITASGGAVNVTDASVQASQVTLTLSRSITAGETVSVTYVVPGTSPVRDSTGTYTVAAFANQAATNNVGSATVIRLVSRNGMTETGDAANGYNYTGTADNSSWSSANAGVADKAIPANTDGWFQFTMGTHPKVNAAPMLILRANATIGNFTTGIVGVYAAQPTSTYLGTTGASGDQAMDVPTLLDPGDIVRLGRVGSFYRLWISKDGGATFPQVKQWTGATTAQLFGEFITYNTTTPMLNLRSSGAV